MAQLPLQRGGDAGGDSPLALFGHWTPPTSAGTRDNNADDICQEVNKQDIWLLSLVRKTTELRI